MLAGVGKVREKAADERQVSSWALGPEGGAAALLLPPRGQSPLSKVRTASSPPT